jgi:hypothetical protein
VNFSSRKRAGFGNYQSSHDTSMFYIGMRILKTCGTRAGYNIFLYETVGGTDYVNSRGGSMPLYFCFQQGLSFGISMVFK